MDSLVVKSRTLWGLEDSQIILVAERENRVFKVTSRNGTFALRVHRKGLRTDAELLSELCWMAELSSAGLSVPCPVASARGSLFHLIEDHQVDMLTWLGGSPLGKTSEPLQHSDRVEVFCQIGQTLAQLHRISDAWIPPDGFVRGSWNRAGLVGTDPLWGRFWENPDLTSAEVQTLRAFREASHEDLVRLEVTLDYGLIHADAVRENIMIDESSLHLIDFDDSGYGYRLFDVATALLKNMGEPDFPELKDALLQGYLGLRPLDVSALDLFLALRAVTYVGWNISRLEEPNGRIRNSRMIAQAIALTETYLSTRTGSSLSTIEVSR
ncbi:phosphotransferase enzyme family protein [Roseibium sp. SCP14]|uniref:phosphotransferase enzyme family protein n=1 Tax=Roseibium sp. SCP14 TaxID=3141375 RepID=UPI0033384658